MLNCDNFYTQVQCAIRMECRAIAYCVAGVTKLRSTVRTAIANLADPCEELLLKTYHSGLCIVIFHSNAIVIPISKYSGD